MQVRHHMRLKTIWKLRFFSANLAYLFIDFLRYSFLIRFGFPALR